MDSLTNLRTATYARFSSANQRDTSINGQVKLCREFLSRNDGPVMDDMALTDYAVSGPVPVRDASHELLRLVETRAIDLVITESRGRLTPDLDEALLDCFIERAFIAWTRSRT